MDLKNPISVMSFLKDNPNNKGVSGPGDEDLKRVRSQAEFNNNWFQNRKINGKSLNVKSRVRVPDSLNMANLNSVDSEGTTYGQYDPSTKEITYDPRFKERIGIPAHEMYHEFQDNLKREDFKRYKSTIDLPIREALKGVKTSRSYDSDPEEISARLQQLRWGKDFKPDQVVTPEDIERLDLSSYDLQNFDKASIVKMLNSVASNSEKRNKFKAIGSFV